MRLTGIILLGAILTLGISGCREQEQNRPLTYNKGVYSGERETAPLTQEQLHELRLRARQQASSGI